MASSSTSTSMASSSTSTSHGNVYNVFLSHRGPDVKKTLASHIYHRLADRAVRVFFDTEEMQVGEELTTQIIDAIRTASVHVAIFSPGYADSHWCLNELVLMLETKKTIIPIFYDVSPSDLRHARERQAREGVYARILSILQCILQCTRGEDRGGYAGALRRLENKTTLDKKTPRYDSKIIENWRNALSSAADISGFEHTSNSDDEGLLLNEVIQRVLEKVPKPLHVAKYPTGLDGKLEELEMIVPSRQQSGNLATAVGIVGLGGIGKTTLAKQFFNNHRSKYDRSCFLSVRENAAKNTLNSSQAQLLKDLTAQNEHLNNAAECIEVLKNLPSSTRALIVVDDVDNNDQLDALFFPMKHTSSLILVTSRNKDVLLSAEIEESSIYVLKGLNQHHSEELFCWHAFKQPNPVKGFEQLVQKFLDACHGLPLSLKVIGALLYGRRDIKYWEEQLAKISIILPKEIQSRLQISYDELDEEEKNIFLDIACFFIGTDRDTAIRIWDGSPWHGWLGLDKLEKRCLVEIDDQNCIAMHDQLRDLGRDLAKDSKYPRRLWHLKDNLHDLSNNSSVRGIHTVNRYVRGIHISLENLVGSCNINSLQLLRAEGDFVDRLFSVGHLPQLIYLQWDNIPYDFLPPWIPIINLRVLYIKGGTLETLWQHESEAPLQLREMVIDAELQMIPESIGKLKHLEKLVLRHWDGFETLPESVANLTNLQSLHLFKCYGLQTLPDSVGNMTNLQSLHLGGCSRLQMLPDSVGNMANLQSLHLGGCSGLQMLPDSVGNMTNLQSLHLGGCSRLQMLPDSVGNMANLQSLHLGGCSGLQMLPDSVGNMTNLQSLLLVGCSGLQMLPDSVGNMTNLQSLDLRKCFCLQMLPESVGNMTNLQSLLLVGCSGLQMLPDSVGNMTNLQSLDLRKCFCLQMLPDSVGNMTNLESLNLAWCYGLQMLPDSVGNMTNLQSLSLPNCYGLRMLPESVGNMTNLQRLELSYCFGLQMLPESVGNMTNLQSLDLMKCSDLQMLPNSVGNMTNLESLDLACCSGLQMLPESVGNMTNLQSLDLRECSGLQMLPNSVGNMTNLKSLDLRECSGLHMLPDSFGNMTNLQSLDLSECSGLQMLPDSVGNMTNLQSLDLRGCSGLQMLPDSVGNITNLESLVLFQCSGLQMLPDSVGNMTNLQSLDLMECSGLQMLPDSVGNMTNLRKLYLMRCSSLQMLPNVEDLLWLEILDVRECPKVQWGAGVVEQLRQRLNTGFRIDEEQNELCGGGT